MVITNRLSNALKFTATGVQPRIRIWAEAAQGVIRLWVQDNGIGIADSDKKQLFDPFERPNSKAAYPGTGLGLAIVRRAVQRMGGQVGVESESGHGSRFWVDLRSAT